MKSPFKFITFIFLILVNLPAVSANTLRLVTTTSTENSGLTDFLITKFTNETDIQVHVVSVGTGKALAIARNGDADIILVHSKTDEVEFVEQGFGLERHAVMYNDFIVVGPAPVEQAKSLKWLLKHIADSNALFISRGDDSGTHKKELALWQQFGINPHGDWYRESGQGMGKTLQIADELQAYTLTDRGTWLAQYNNRPLSLGIVFENDETLFNPYSAIVINPEKFPHVNVQAALRFIHWLVSPQGQALIAEYKINNQQLFFPNAN